ncbi:TlpA disulfide reductase family protein [Tenacibaculum sp. SG-28]|uniref:TlpA disulfide reductase family protein n=1 Tax=Tenacibaculum sp. SG-28 TaxID=754426 RepID=UPI000CF539E3|nr:TlpA disulfide reductase family protein [Tenacibaculum sp. SG-28]PQJ22899.1 thioredoxin [Tenacibaculum sp. SG-28]
MNKRIHFILTILLLAISCQQKKDATKNTIVENTKEIEVVTLDYKALKPYLSRKDDKTYVVNFWATWCVPCVKELPAFEKLYANYKDNNVEVLLVSLDFPKQVEESLIPFMRKHNLQATVLHFVDNDEQFWIKDIAESWTGSIPATLIYNTKERKFFEHTFNYEELQKELQTFLN